jgi:uncharacterized phage infection (PIP) family protein YhgE
MADEADLDSSIGAFLRAEAQLEELHEQSTELANSISELAEARNGLDDASTGLQGLSQKFGAAIETWLIVADKFEAAVAALTKADPASMLRGIEALSARTERLQSRLDEVSGEVRRGMEIGQQDLKKIVQDEATKGLEALSAKSEDLRGRFDEFDSEIRRRMEKDHQDLKQILQDEARRASEFRKINDDRTGDLTRITKINRVLISLSVFLSAVVAVLLLLDRMG